MVRLGAELYMTSWIRGMLFNKQADQLSRWINKDPICGEVVQRIQGQAWPLGGGLVHASVECKGAGLQPWWWALEV